MNPITISRFWSKVDKGETCWIWKASKRSKGYGAFVYPSEKGDIIQGRAHRFSWELHRGAIPDGMCVLHKCDVPACVNPDHLWLGSKAENNRDMTRKGRHVPGGTKCGKNGKWPRGINHHNAKLTPEQATSIRSEYAAENTSLSILAKKYNVSPTTIFQVIHRKNWRHV